MLQQAKFGTALGIDDDQLPIQDRFEREPVQLAHDGGNSFSNPWCKSLSLSSRL